MKFDGNRAWNAAVRAVSVNREVLLVLAGVFFFLPGMAAALFLAGYQAQTAASVAAVMAAPGSRPALQAMMRAYSDVAPCIILLLLVQVLGYMAMLALLTDRRRPTVGEAIGIGARGLPALVGAFVVFVLGYVAASLPLGLVLFGCIAGLGPQVGTALGLTIDLAAVGLVITRLSLTLPVIVIEGLHRPVAALQRSWRMTAGNGLRLLGFYLMLAIAYIVITAALGVLLNLLSAATGPTQAYVLVAGGISGMVAAATSIVLTAILAAVHRQLAGSSQGAVSETFL